MASICTASKTNPRSEGISHPRKIAIFLDSSLYLALDQLLDLLHAGLENFFHFFRCDGKCWVAPIGVDRASTDQTERLTDFPSLGCAAEVVANLILPVMGHNLLYVFRRNMVHGVIRYFFELSDHKLSESLLHKYRATEGT